MLLLTDCISRAASNDSIRKLRMGSHWRKHKSARATNSRETNSGAGIADGNDLVRKQNQLQRLLQQIYQAENTVKMETTEVRRLQELVTAADRELEEANHQVRVISRDLQEAQRLAAQKALKSHTAHLQLSAHDQLMFTSRQRVDALSAQAVAVQAELNACVPQPAYASNASQLNPNDQQAGTEQMLQVMYPQAPQLDPGSRYVGPPAYFYNGVGPVPQPNAPPYFPVMPSGVPNGYQYIPVEGK
ncbi:Protein of unknown function (DUF745) [Nesidiocoris tenuis]|uniref:Uncharacterized protein n=1 Tax=Nesidiocoris tenuis TaxID=355587 RepID=A0ABN7BCF3_9HEMI|nr:Protein of unknown function (DUF745) [Nesidiocoris tenuis]